MIQENCSTAPISFPIIAVGNNGRPLSSAQHDRLACCRWKDITKSAMTNSSACQTNKAAQIRARGQSVDGRQGASFQLRETECGSSAQSCQANVIQTVNGAEVAVGKREIPHCITTLLSKLYYLGHSLLYGCQSYHTHTKKKKKKNWNRALFGFACTHT